MSSKSLGLGHDLHAYLLRYGMREHPLLARLRAETAPMPEAHYQIAPEQGAFMALLVELMGARRCVEVGTFTGYSSLAVALALPDDGTLVCCDVSDEYTRVARRYWAEAGVAGKVELRLGRAIDSLDALLAEGGGGTFDFAFLDADKPSYPAYYERLLELLRPGGLLAIDNVLYAGRVVAPPGRAGANAEAIRTLNAAIAEDARVTISMVPIADGLTLARKR